METFESKIVWAYGKNFKTVQTTRGSDCSNCDANKPEYTCEPFLVDMSCAGIHFKVIQEKIELPSKPTLQMNLELDLSGCILPVFFKVKGLKVHSLDAAIAKGTSDYNIAVGDIPQESLEGIAEALKAEFIRRNTKEGANK